LIDPGLLARTLHQNIGDQNRGGTNLEFAAQAFELAGASEPRSLEGDRAAKRDGTVGRKLFKDLIARPVRIIAKPARLDGLGDLVGLRS
jgi:hypothetical protein